MIDDATILKLSIYKSIASLDAPGRNGDVHVEIEMKMFKTDQRYDVVFHR